MITCHLAHQTVTLTFTDIHIYKILTNTELPNTCSTDLDGSTEMFLNTDNSLSNTHS